MKEALVNYSKKSLTHSAYNTHVSMRALFPDLLRKFKKILVQRTTQNNFESFRDRSGFELHDDKIVQ